MSKDLSSKVEKGKTTQQARNSIVVASAISVFTVGLFITAQFIGVLILLFGSSLLGMDRTELSKSINNNIPLQFLSIFLVEISILGLLFAWFRKRKANFLNFVGLKKRPTLLDVFAAVITYGLYFLTFLAVMIFLGALLPNLNVDQAQQLGVSVPHGLDYGLVFISLVILPAVTEEILFRGFLFGQLKRVITPIVAGIVTSLIFGAAHLEFFSDGPLNYVAAIDTFILSLFLVYIYYKTDSLWQSVFLHAIKNTIAFVLLFII